MREHPVDCRIDRATEPPPLRGEIDERDWRVGDAGVLIHHSHELIDDMRVTITR
jgi:hypothetical protein